MSAAEKCRIDREVRDPLACPPCAKAERVDVLNHQSSTRRRMACSEAPDSLRDDAVRTGFNGLVSTGSISSVA